MSNQLYQQLQSYIEYYFSQQKLIAFPKGKKKQLLDVVEQNSQSTNNKKPPLFQKQATPSFPLQSGISETPLSISTSNKASFTNFSTVSLDSLSLRIYGCQECNLCLNRKNIVFGQGNQSSKIFLIGEAPGAEEDKEGIPFVGLAGQLLNRMLLGIAIARGAVYVTNIVKCRPPSNRNPQKQEMETCSKILKKQIQILQPKLILLLGSVAFQYFFSGQGGIMKNHGKQFFYEQGSMRIPTIATFHPAYLLRQPQDLALAWQDFRKIRQLIAHLGIV